VPAGEATLPVDRDAHLFADSLDMNDNLVHQMPDDFLRTRGYTGFLETGKRPDVLRSRPRPAAHSKPTAQPAQ
jgi:hypothetical protein